MAFLYVLSYIQFIGWNNIKVQFIVGQCKFPEHERVCSVIAKNSQQVGSQTHCATHEVDFFAQE